MTTSTWDVLIMIPLIPLAPIVITWWLPWERWIPWGKLPKAVLGPYLLYASFGSWHFKFGWFVVATSFLAGAAISLDRSTASLVHCFAIKVTYPEPLAYARGSECGVLSRERKG